MSGPPAMQALTTAAPAAPARSRRAGTEQVKNVNKNNAVHAIVFEAVAVAINLQEPELMALGVAMLAKFLSVRVLGLLGRVLRLLGRPTVCRPAAGALLTWHHACFLPPSTGAGAQPQVPGPGEHGAPGRGARRCGHGCAAAPCGGWGAAPRCMLVRWRPAAPCFRLAAT